MWSVRAQERGNFGQPDDRRALLRRALHLEVLTIVWVWVVVEAVAAVTVGWITTSIALGLDGVPVLPDADAFSLAGGIFRLDLADGDLTTLTSGGFPSEPEGSRSRQHPNPQLCSSG